ncbi:MAG: hypothetical protein LBU23_06655 [Planctomycetota bacterium]|jgi:hypothetical protein|nr:hypothetical protein [Planctomycetota bacterium]
MARTRQAERGQVPEDPKLQARIIGANLRHLRKLRFPSWGGQKKFAEFLNLTANDLCVYEYGRAVPNELRLSEMAARLGMTAEELRRPLPGVKVPPPSSEAPAANLTAALSSRERGARLEQIEELKRDVARLEGRLEVLLEQNQAKEELIRQLREANYTLRDLLYVDDSSEAGERRGRLLRRLDPSIVDLAGRRDVF